MGKGESLIVSFILAALAAYLVERYILSKMKFFQIDEKTTEDKFLWTELYLAVTIGGVFVAAIQAISYVLLKFFGHI